MPPRPRADRRYGTADVYKRQDIAKVTERHTDGGGNLRQHIDGCHDEDRVQQALQIGKDAVGLDLVAHDPVSYTHLAPQTCG